MGWICLQCLLCHVSSLEHSQLNPPWLYTQGKIHTVVSTQAWAKYMYGQTQPALGMFLIDPTMG